MVYAKDIHKAAHRNALIHGAARIETLVITGVSAVLFVLSALNLVASAEFSWVWAALGLAGAAGVMLNTLRNKALLRKLVSAEMDQRVDITSMHTPELQAGVARARRQHRAITQLLAQRPEGVDHIVESLDEWAMVSYDIARNLDAVLADPNLAADCRDAARAMGLAVASSDNSNATALARFAALVAHGAPGAGNPAAYDLMLALHVAIQVRAELSLSIERMTNVKTALNRARQHTFDGRHVRTIESVLSMQLSVLNDAQNAVFHLGRAYARAR